VQNAESSVLYAIMELAGGGPVLEDVRDLAKRKHIFSYGMSQTLTGLKVYKPGESHALVAPFVALKGKVPPPFHEEYSGGSGIVIHHKFIVIDFNGPSPVVFAGSSNLAGGGEEANGDNLLAIYDPEVAAAYAVEAVRLVDHYHFRAMAHNTDDETPIYLEGPDAKTPWWEPFYDPKNILNTERLLFAR
jgi:phosphatidylserine/phosphatidylglycerophosphate/cardiolipin synthase-like enzyme